MEFFALTVLGFTGILIHLMMKFRDAITKVPKEGRPFIERLKIVWSEFDLLGNVMYAFFALVIVLVCVGLRDKLLQLGFPITSVSILFVGYAADSALKNIMPQKK